MALLFDTTNPLAAAYLGRNPTGIFAMLAANAAKTSNTGTNPDVSGSNNSGYSMGGQGSGMGGRNPNMAMSTPQQFKYARSGNIQSFEEGGMFGSSGEVLRPGDGMMAASGPELGAASTEELSSESIEEEARNFVQQHPEEVQKIQEVIALAMQTGELTSQELNTAVQLAKTALAAPETYPQIRQYAIKNGLGTEQDIPPTMDQGLLYVLVVVGKSMQNGAPPQNKSAIPEYSDGGLTGDKEHIAKLHPGEYVIPKDVLTYHGKKHFDKLVEQARTPPNAEN
jgi:hypothetical protein